MSVASKTIELKICDVVYRGKGLARVDGQVVFVPGVVAGETVRVRIEKQFKNYSEARLLEVCEASPLRTSPICPHFMRAGGGSSQSMYCAGCTYQHMAYSEELRVKQDQFVNFMERMAGVDKALVEPAMPSPDEIGYRNKIVLHGGDTPDEPVLGYVAYDNKTVIDVPMCLLAQKEINELLKTLRKDRAFMSSQTQGRRLTLRHTPADGPVFWTGRSAEGGAWLTEASGVGDLLVPRDSFAQINTRVAHALVRKVVSLLKASSPSAAIDLYCGAGLFSFAAAEAGVTRIFGVDNDPSAVRAAQRNANVRSLNGCVFLARSAEAGLKEILNSVGTEGTTIIVDPSRRGLEKGVSELLASARPPKIIYVSCAPDTMARDVAHLCRAGYSVTSAQLLDMFPRTAYFESITCLETGTK